MIGTVQYKLECGLLEVEVVANPRGVGMVVRYATTEQQIADVLLEVDDAKALIRTLQWAVDFYEEEQDDADP